MSRLDHDANIRPWVQAAERSGATMRWVSFDPETGELDPGAVGRLLSDRTRLVAVTAASNLIGTRPDLPAIADLVHGTGALTRPWSRTDGSIAATDDGNYGAGRLTCHLGMTRFHRQRPSTKA